MGQDWRKRAFHFVGDQLFHGLRIDAEPTVLISMPSVSTVRQKCVRHPGQQSKGVGKGSRYGRGPNRHVTVPVSVPVLCEKSRF